MIFNNELFAYSKIIFIFAVLSVDVFGVELEVEVVAICSM